MKRNPLDGEALLLAGDHYARTGQREKAEFRYDAAAKLEAFSADAFLKQAQLKVAQQKYPRGRGTAPAGPEGEAARQRRPGISSGWNRWPPGPAPDTPMILLPGRRPVGTSRPPRRRQPANPGADRPAWVAWLVLLLFRGRLGNRAAVRAGHRVRVRGHRREGWDGRPLAGVTVTVRGTTLATTTDAQGRFQLNGVPPGDQAVRFSRSGYAATVVTDVRVLPGQSTTVNGTLRPDCSRTRGVR